LHDPHSCFPPTTKELLGWKGTPPCPLQTHACLQRTGEKSPSQGHHGEMKTRNQFFVEEKKSILWNALQTLRRGGERMVASNPATPSMPKLEP